jgi:hypothetical protein
MEYTRIDQLVDVMFTAATDVEASVVEAAADEDVEEVHGAHDESGAQSTWELTDSTLLQRKREQIVEKISELFKVKFINRSRALCWDASHQTRIVTTISKRYTKRASNPYWYAYHPKWDEFLSEGQKSFFVLGCMDLSVAFLIPRGIIRSVLGGLHTTTTDRGTYWHIHIAEDSAGQYELVLPKRSENLSLQEYRISLG